MTELSYGKRLFARVHDVISYADDFISYGECLISYGKGVIS
jgi:retron-type reverse transcriptase